MRRKEGQAHRLRLQQPGKKQERFRTGSMVVVIVQSFIVSFLRTSTFISEFDT